MERYLFFARLVIILGAVTYACMAIATVLSQPELDNEVGQVSILPVYEFAIDQESMVIPVAIHNRTDNSIRYAAHGAAFYGLEMRLTRNGRPVPQEVPSMGPPMQEHVRELRPGEVGIANVNLRSRYLTVKSGMTQGVISPGTYVLELGFDARALDLGLTELKKPVRPAAVVVITEHERDGNNNGIDDEPDDQKYLMDPFSNVEAGGKIIFTNTTRSRVSFFSAQYVAGTGR